MLHSDLVAQDGRRAFWGLWAGQLISNLGTQVSLYGVGLWLFQQHERLTDFAAVAAVVQLAKVLVLPLLGPRLQRWPRRRVMVVANGLGAVSSLALALLLLAAARPPLAAVLGLQALAAVGEAALVLSFSTLIPQLVPEGPERSRANGLFVTADGLVATTAPFLGAWLAGAAGLRGVLLLDALSFLVAMGLVLLVRWPAQALRPAAGWGAATAGSGTGAPGVRGGAWRGALARIWRDPQLRPLALVGMAMTFVYAATEVLFPAWVAASFGVQRLGGALLAGGLGYLYGYRLWLRLPAERWAPWWRAALVAQALILMGAGLVLFQGLVLIWFAGLACFSAGLPVALSALQSRWQQGVAPAEMPLLFSARFSLEWGARLLAFGLSGPLVDGLLRPALAWPHWPAWLPQALGTGDGRPMAVGLGAMGWVLMLALWSQWRGLAPRRRPGPDGGGKLGPCGP